MAIKFTPALRGLGVCALFAALTTFLNTMAPKFYEANGFDAAAALIYNPIYAARQWILLVHPAFTLLLALGFTLAIFERSPGRASSGLAFAGVEKMTEFVLGVLILFVVNAQWKASYLVGDGSVSAEDLRGRIQIFYELLSGLYFLLWSMFILSTGLLVSALNRTDSLELAVILTAGLTILLTVFLILGRYAGMSAWTDSIVYWSYGPVLTVHRLLIGFWLLRQSSLLSCR
ncbi:MAG: hypothetical protein AAF098_12215 [Pseudomonadota bacterium]